MVTVQSVHIGQPQFTGGGVTFTYFDGMDFHSFYNKEGYSMRYDPPPAVGLLI